MVKCVCDKTIDKIPSWLDSVKVDFVCNNCPKRQIKTISQLHAEQQAALAKAASAEKAALEAEQALHADDDDEPVELGEDEV